jgi:hypothetical protein
MDRQVWIDEGFAARRARTLGCRNVTILGLNPEPIDLESPSVGPPYCLRIWAAGGSTESDRCPEECAPSSVDAGRFSCGDESLGRDMQMPRYQNVHTMDGLVADEIYEVS